MKRHTVLFTVIIAAILFTVIGGAPQVSHANIVQWYPYDEGMALGKAEGKKVYINFYAAWCQYCRRMDKKTFTDPAVVSYLNENFISIRVDVDREKDVASQYNVSPLPDSWFITETGEGIGNRPGYMSAEDLLPVLQFIHTGSYLKMSYTDFLKKNGKKAVK
jgi:thioredoxin-related protein